MVHNLSNAKVLNSHFEDSTFYANRADLHKVIQGVGWTAYHIEVNANISTRLIGNFSPYEDFRNGSFSASYDADSHTLIVSRNDIPLYSLNVEFITVEEHDTVEIFTASQRQIFFVVFEQEVPAEQKPRFFTHDDLNPTDLPTCGELNVSTAQPTSENKVTCGRPLGHYGEHQYITEYTHGKFEHTSGSSMKWGKKFGIPTPCAECGAILEGNGIRAEDKVCFTCSYWRTQLATERDKAFVIDGTHYRAGEGGYGGRQFAIKRFDGTVYKGGLWFQGKIPTHFVSRFPNDAEFVIKKMISAL